MTTINLEDHQFNLEINRKNIRSIRLKLLAADSISVSCPKFTPDSIIKKFIDNNKEWILKQSQKIIPKTKLSDLNSIKIIGMDYKIFWHSTSKDSVLFFDQKKEIHINTVSFAEKHLKILINQKFKIFALRLIKRELESLAHEFNFKYNHVTLRNQKTRYGSCSSRNNLNFNWQVIFFPYPIFRHILLHEAAHLKEKNHKKAFWQLLTYYDSNCKFNNNWLKLEGTKHFVI
jgi:predicted metal-dependent hydrolase